MRQILEDQKQLLERKIRSLQEVSNNRGRPLPPSLPLQLPLSLPPAPQCLPLPPPPSNGILEHHSSPLPSTSVILGGNSSSGGGVGSQQTLMNASDQSPAVAVAPSAVQSGGLREGIEGNGVARAPNGGGGASLQECQDDVVGAAKAGSSSGLVEAGGIERYSPLLPPVSTLSPTVSRHAVTAAGGAFPQLSLQVPLPPPLMQPPLTAAPPMPIPLPTAVAAGVAKSAEVVHLACGASSPLPQGLLVPANESGCLGAGSGKVGVDTATEPVVTTREFLPPLPSLTPVGAAAATATECSDGRLGIAGPDCPQGYDSRHGGEVDVPQSSPPSALMPEGIDPATVGQARSGAVTAAAAVFTTVLPTKTESEMVEMVAATAPGAPETGAVMPHTENGEAASGAALGAEDSVIEERREESAVAVIVSVVSEGLAGREDSLLDVGDGGGDGRGIGAAPGEGQLFEQPQEAKVQAGSVLRVTERCEERVVDAVPVSSQGTTMGVATTVTPCDELPPPKSASSVVAEGERNHGSKSNSENDNINDANGSVCALSASGDGPLRNRDGGKEKEGGGEGGPCAEVLPQQPWALPQQQKQFDQGRGGGEDEEAVMTQVSESAVKSSENVVATGSAAAAVANAIAIATAPVGAQAAASDGVAVDVDVDAIAVPVPVAVGTARLQEARIPSSSGSGGAVGCHGQEAGVSERKGERKRATIDRTSGRGGEEVQEEKEEYIVEDSEEDVVVSVSDVVAPAEAKNGDGDSNLNSINNASSVYCSTNFSSTTGGSSSSGNTTNVLNVESPVLVFAAQEPPPVKQQPVLQQPTPGGKERDGEGQGEEGGQDRGEPNVVVDVASSDAAISLNSMTMSTTADASGFSAGASTAAAAAAKTDASSTAEEDGGRGVGEGEGTREELEDGAGDMGDDYRRKMAAQAMLSFCR